MMILDQKIINYLKLFSFYRYHFQPETYYSNKLIIFVMKKIVQLQKDINIKKIDLLYDAFKNICLVNGISSNYSKSFLQSIDRKHYRNKSEQYKVKKYIIAQQINLIQKEQSSPQKINTLLHQREQLVRSLRKLLIGNISTQQSIEKCCILIDKIRTYNLIVLQSVQQWRKQLKLSYQSAYFIEIILQINQDIDFIKISYLRKYMQFAISKDPLFIWPLQHQLQNTSISEKHVNDLFNITLRFKQRLYRANDILLQIQKINQFRSIPIDSNKLNKHSSQYLNQNINSIQSNTTNQNTSIRKNINKNIVLLPFICQKKKYQNLVIRKKPEVEQVIRQAIIKYQKRKRQQKLHRSLISSVANTNSIKTSTPSQNRNQKLYSQSRSNIRNISQNKLNTPIARYHPTMDVERFDTLKSHKNLNLTPQKINNTNNQTFNQAKQQQSIAKSQTTYKLFENEQKQQKKIINQHFFDKIRKSKKRRLIQIHEKEEYTADIVQPPHQLINHYKSPFDLMYQIKSGTKKSSISQYQDEENEKIQKKDKIDISQSSFQQKIAQKYKIYPPQQKQVIQAQQFQKNQIEQQKINNRHQNKFIETSQNNQVKLKQTSKNQKLGDNTYDKNNDVEQVNALQSSYLPINQYQQSQNETQQYSFSRSRPYKNDIYLYRTPQRQIGHIKRIQHRKLHTENINYQPKMSDIYQSQYDQEQLEYSKDSQSRSSYYANASRRNVKRNLYDESDIIT